MSNTYVGIGDDRLPSLGIAELEILRIMWAFGRGCTVDDFVRTVVTDRIRSKQNNIKAKNTIIHTLDRLIKKKLVTKEKGARLFIANKYFANVTRDAVLTAVIKDVTDHIMAPVMCITEEFISDSKGNNK